MIFLHLSRLTDGDGKSGDIIEKLAFQICADRVFFTVSWALARGNRVDCQRSTSSISSSLLNREIEVVGF